MTEGYIIDFHTGVIEYAETLEEAKTKAEEGMAYTQQNVDICDYETGEVVTTSHWWGVVPDYDLYEDESYVICQFGDFGYYEKWTDEIN